MLMRKVDNPEAYDFDVYRPPKPSGRLDPVYIAPNEKEWRPSLSYKHSLQDIKNQYTPSEFFRHRLQTSGKEIRAIQRLELRYNRNLEAFTNAAIKIQALHRGNVGRAYFNSVKVDLANDLARRRSYQAASQALQAEQLAEALHACLSAQEHPEYLLDIQIRCQYRLEKYEDCIATSMVIIELNKRNEEAYFLQACSWCKLEQYDNAMDILRTLTIIQASCSDDVYRLFAAVSVKMDPPQYDNAIDSLSQVIKRNPRDFQALYERASCYSCVQEWSDAVVDLKVILAYHPIDKRALFFRARVYACMREWNQAKADYELVLLHYPGNTEALERMKTIEIFKNDALEVTN